MVANYVDGDTRRFDSYKTEADALAAAETLAKRLDARDYVAASMTKGCGTIELSAQDSPINPGVRRDLEYIMNLLLALKPECYDLIWKHYITGFDYAEIADEKNSKYDAIRVKIGRCLQEAKTLTK